MSAYGERMAARMAASHYRKHNDWQTETTLEASCHDLPDQSCPNCKHRLAEHNDEGCGLGWNFGSQDGCECVLTLAEQFR